MSLESEVLADSPLLYFRLDETSGSATDDGSYGGSGTVVSCTQGERTCAATGGGTSYKFNGTTSRVGIGQSPSAAFAATNLTIEAWVVFDNIGGTGANQTILATNAVDHPSGCQLQVTSDGEHLVMGGRVTFGGAYESVQSAYYPFENRVPYHVAMTADVSGTTGDVKFYVNGVQLGDTDTWTYGALTWGSTAGQIGARYFSGSPGAWFEGWIDEVAYYTSQLSATRLLAHYNAGRGTAAATPAAYKYLWVRGDGVSGSDLTYDSSPNQCWMDYTGTPQLSDAVSPPNGKGTCILFDGTDDRIEPRPAEGVNWFANLYETSPWTVAVDVHPLAITGNHYVISKRNPGGTSHGWLINCNPSGYVNFTMLNSTGGTYGTMQSTTALTTGSWFNIEVCYDGFLNWYLFIDGVLEDTIVESDLSGTNGTDHLAADLWIGANERVANEEWNGYMSEIIIEDVCRHTATFTVTYEDDPSEPYFDAVMADSPINYWRLNEATGSDHYDHGSNAQHAVNYGNMQQKQGALVPGYASGSTIPIFTAGTQEGQISGSMTFPTGTFTLEGWFMWYSGDIGSTETSPAIIQIGHDTTVYTGVFFSVNRTNSRLIVGFGDGGGTGSGNRKTYFTPNNSVSKDTLTHAVAIIRSISDIDIYINGVQQTLTNSGTATTINKPNNYMIGRNRQAKHSMSFPLAEVAVYGSELTSTQINNHYDAGWGANWYPTIVKADSPYLYLRNDIGRSTTEPDQGSNGNTWTHVFAPSYGYHPIVNSGAGAACRYNIGGTGGEYTRLSPTSSGDLTATNATLEAWVRHVNMPDSTAYVVLATGDNTDATGSGWNMQLRDVSWSDRGLALGGYVPSVGNQTLVAEYDWVEGEVYHLVITTSGADGDVNFYVNGELIDTQTWVGATPVCHTDYATVGGMFSGGVMSNNFDGWIDEAAFYKTTLSAESITAHYDAGTYVIATGAADSGLFSIMLGCNS